MRKFFRGIIAAKDYALSFIPPAADYLCIGQKAEVFLAIESARYLSSQLEGRFMLLLTLGIPRKDCQPSMTDAPSIDSIVEER